MDDIGLWFSKEVGRWRTGASVAWGILLLPPVAISFISLATIDLLHPLQWISNILANILSINSWAYVSILCGIVAISAVWNSKHYCVSGEVLSSRLASLLSVLKPYKLLHGLAHTIAGGVAVWCYACLVKGRFENLSRVCEEDSDKLCLNEHHFFLVLHGAVVGLMFSIQFFIGKNHLSFPVVQQSKLFQVKSSFYPTLYSSAHQVLTELKYYYLIYYLLLGHIFKEWIIHSLNLFHSPSDAVDTLYGLLDIGLLCNTFLSGVMVLFLLQCTILLYKVYHAQAFMFKIEAAFDQEKDKCLLDALKCEKYPSVQFLGFLDLCRLSKNSAARRAEVFSLSLPGGHPHHWNTLSGECLTLLDTLGAQLIDYNQMACNGVVRQLSGDRQPITAQRGLDSTNQSMQNSTLNYTPVTNITYRGAEVQSPTSPEDPKKDLNSAKEKSTEQKKRKPSGFLLGELPDAVNRKLFADCQKHMWAAEALSYLVTASYSEDKYGVVQKSLPTILTSMLGLLDAVEKHTKLATNVPRKNSRSLTPTDVTATRQALVGALKSGLYRIVNQFGKHMDTVSLNREHQRRLMMFMDYKE